MEKKVIRIYKNCILIDAGTYSYKMCLFCLKKKKEKKADTHISLFTFKYTTFPYETTML